MATIRRRGVGQFQTIVKRQGYPVRRKTFTSRREAEAWGRMIESEMDRGIYVDRAEAERTSLAEALRRYQKEITPTKKGREQESNRIDQILTWPIAQRPLASIRGVDVAELVKQLSEQGKSPNTIRLLLAIISHLFTIASRDWGMESLTNPVQKIRKPKLPRGRNRRLTADEEARVMEAAVPALRPVIGFALETAMRLGELMSMRWEHIDLKARTVYLQETKNGEDRTVPLSPRAIEILRSLPRDGSGRVWGYTNSNSMRNAWWRATAAAGVEDMTFHDLRHEATSRLFERGDLNVMEVAAITGHKSMQMLKRYTHLRASDLAEKLHRS